MSKACNRLLPLALLALALPLAFAAPVRAQEEEKSEWLEVGQVKAQAAAQQVARADDAPADAPAAAAPQQPQPTPTPLPPLTAGQKVRRSLRGAFLNPASYAIAAFNGGIRQIGEDRLPHKDTEDELADWGSTHRARLRHAHHLRLLRQRRLPGAVSPGPALRALAQEGRRQPRGARRQPSLRDARRQRETSTQLLALRRRGHVERDGQHLGAQHARSRPHRRRRHAQALRQVLPLRRHRQPRPGVRRRPLQVRG